MTLYANWHGAGVWDWTRDPGTPLSDARNADNEAFAAWYKRRAPAETACRQEAYRTAVPVRHAPEGRYCTTIMEDDLQNDVWGRGTGPGSRHMPQVVSMGEGDTRGGDDQLQMRHSHDLASLVVVMRRPFLYQRFRDEVSSDVSLIHDWFINQDARTQAKLARMTFAHAMQAQARWHAAEARRREREPEGIEIEGETFRLNYMLRPGACSLRRGYHVPLTPAVGEGERIESIGGRYWTRLLTRAAFEQESVYMSHCVGWSSQDYMKRYVDDAPPHPVGIWNLREQGGDTSLLTAEVALEEPKGPATTMQGFVDRLAKRTPKHPPCWLVQVRSEHNREVPMSLVKDMRLLADYARAGGRTEAELAAIKAEDKAIMDTASSPFVGAARVIEARERRA